MNRLREFLRGTRHELASGRAMMRSGRDSARADSRVPDELPGHRAAIVRFSDGVLSFGLDLTRDYAEFGVRMSEVPIVLVNQRPPNSHGVRSQGSPRAGANQSS